MEAWLFSIFPVCAHTEHWLPENFFRNIPRGSRDQQWRRTFCFFAPVRSGFFSSYFDMNANKRLREGSSSSSMSDISDSELSLKCIMEKLESIQQSLGADHLTLEGGGG